MVRKTRNGKVAAKVLATILSVSMGLSTLSFSEAGAVAYAKGAEVVQMMDVTDDIDITDISDAETELLDVDEYQDFDDEYDEAEDSFADEAEDYDAYGDAQFQDDAEFTAVHDELVEFTQDTATSEGIKTTTSKWDFGTAKNKGVTTAAGDSFNGIVVGGGSGRVIFDAGKDLNVKNNSTAETTGVIYIPIADDSNVVTIKITPMDSQASRYLSVGSFDSQVFLIDNKEDAEHQSVTFKADLKDYVVDAAGDVAGQFIPLYSHGNFKTGAIELVETDAVTIVDVSGKISGTGSDKVTGLKFKNETTGEIFTCDVTGGEYNVSLPNGFKYIVSVSGTFEYGIDSANEGNILDLTTGNDKTKAKDFALVEVQTISISGALTIAKIDNANDVSADTLKATLVPAKTTLDSVELALTKGADDYHYTYTAVILPNEEYSLELTNANDYEFTGKINSSENKEIDFAVTAKDLHKVSLDAVTHNLEVVDSVTALTVKNLDDSYEYSFENLTGKTLEIAVRDGLYEVTSITTTGSYEPYEHFEVKGADVSEKMYLKNTAEKSAVAYKEELTVGKEGCDYTTIYDVLDAVKRMERAADQRVTIVLKDAYYQEQVVVDEPNITFTSALSEGSTISWYYGLGGESYYSAYLNKAIDNNHLFYDEAHAVDRYESATIGQTPGNWGSTVNLKATATGFKAENITFENSFNFYISDVEKEDIATSGNILDRKAEGADPKRYKSKERACTMYNRGANNIEFYNCNFISSQDTLYTGDKDEYSYYYNCTIEGTTDFICGDGNAVFDNCDLVLYGFSDQVINNLVIVASKGSATKGYLFNYCTISADKREGIQTSTSAYLGRPWGTSTEKVAFMNTILESNLIQDKGWTTMNTVPSLNEGLHEYRTRLSDGTAVDLGVRVAANIGTDKEGTAANYVLNSDEGYTRDKYISADWTPSYLGADYSAVNEQVLRYNAVVADEAAYAQLDADKKAALENAYKAVVKGLFVKDQATVDAFAADLEKAIDVVAGKVTKTPVSSVSAGKYTEKFEVVLSTETEGATIYYTTDGTVPSATNGTKYEAPITVDATVTIKAIAVKEGFADSEVAVFEYTIEEAKEPSETTEFVLESSALTAFAAGAKADGETEKAGTEDYFTLYYSAKSKIDSTSAKTWEDGYEAAQRINFGGKPTIVDGQAKNAVKFTTSNAADVKIWWVANKDTYQMALLNSEGQKLAATNVTTTSNLPYFSTFRVDEAGTYYLGGDEVNNYIFKIVVTEDKVAAPVAYDLESKNLTAFAANEANDGKSEKAGTEDYFTLYYSAKSKIDSTSAKTWEDGYEAAQRINFGGKPTIVDGQAKNAIGFTTSGEADVKIWWVANKDAYQMALLNSEGQKLAATDVATTSNLPYFSTFKIENAGTYYIGGDEVNNYIFKVEVTEGSEPEEIKRAEWESVAAPAITNVTLDETNANNVVVNVTSEIGVDGGDRLDVTMFDSEGKEVKTLGSTATKTEFTFTFSPAKSGKYTFSATLSREDEETVKTSAVSDAFEFVLPLVTPEFKNVVNQGKGNVKVNFYSVPEATGYVLTATDKTDSKKKPVEKKFTLKNADANDSTEYTHVFKGLTAGHTYEISLVAVRGEETTKANTLEVNVTKEAETEWVFSAFGTGVTKGSNAGFTANENGSVTVWNTGNKGKLVPASTDGLAFYYTAVPANKNFTLTAKATIDTWTFTNGQEGFGLMAADRVGVNGNAATFWNNSYMATATKVEYYYDRANHVVTNVDTADKISMKLGLGSQEKIGVTPSNLERLEANDSTAVKEFFSSKMTPLETSCGDMGPGTYNLFAKEASGSVKGTVENPLTEVTLRIQKNNTGYFVSYLDNEGNVLKTVKYYDTKALNKLDSKYVYVGFFAARTFKVTFSDIELKVIDPSKDAKAEPKEPTYVEPSYKVISPEYSNTAKYELSYSGNADGVLTITDETGYAVVDRQKVKAGAVKKVNVRLEKGDNKFTVTFTPNKNFNPGGDKYQKLSNYDTFTFEHNVKYQTVNDSDKIFVDPNGDAKAEGTAEAPVDIYTALKFVQAGQTIVLTPGTYNLKSGLVIEKGIDGTAAEPITMVAEGGRAVLDFGGRNTDKGGAGFVIAGNYWNIKGIDVTKTGNGDKGILLAGSHNTLEDIRTYENGNTGIQVSRYLKYEWPSYDLILNCTSFSNADAGYEDADGFAAKLTCGEGIVFDGCISYNNADDGWDLFAKVENGSIGQVTIQNCVAFANGYGVDGKNEGNGNGFKMGGESMPGAHKLINSVAWGNKAKGIDSNSGPDIQVYNCMSFNNGANNVALYTNDAANTNYLVNGVISYRTTGKETNENFKLRGTQDESRVYGKNNFFWMDGASKNADGVTITDDWFVFDKNNKIDALAAPKADVNDPYAVAAAMRTEDGRIDLGNFLKLSETGIKALEAAGVDTAVAALDGAYTAVADERQIEGSANDAAQGVPGFELENFSTKLSYTGKKLTQDFSVYYDGKLLAEGVDYSVAYKNNVNVGTAVVTISGKGIYKGKTVETFRIVPADIAEAAVAVKAVNETGKEANKKYPKVTATVVYMGKTLKAGKDYQVVVNWDEEPKTTTVKDAKGNDITVKHYPVSITGLGNFDGEYKNADVLVFGKGQKIVKTALDLFNIKSGSLELATTAYVYDGTAKTPEVTVYTGKGAKKGEKLDASRYTVKYSGNVNKGTATVTVTGIESQKTTGTLTARFTIAAADISAATVAPIEPVEYVKGGVKPAPVVKLGENTLREGVDYKLTYAGTNKIGLTGKKAPKVTITGLKNFKGSVVKTFEITTKGIDKATVITTDKAIKKNAKGKYLVSKPVVYDENGKALKEKTDYTLKFFYGESEITSKTVLTEGNNEVKVVVTGKGAYTGETSATYQIRTLNKLSQVKSAKISAQKYTGSAVRPDDKIRLYTETRTGKTVATKNLVRGTDYEIALCYNNVKQGTATYVLRGMGEYTGYKTVTFKITKAATK